MLFMPLFFSGTFIKRMQPGYDLYGNNSLIEDTLLKNDGINVQLMLNASQPVHSTHYVYVEN